VTSIVSLLADISGGNSTIPNGIIRIRALKRRVALVISLNLLGTRLEKLIHGSILLDALPICLKSSHVVFDAIPKEHEKLPRIASEYAMIVDESFERLCISLISRGGDDREDGIAGEEHICQVADHTINLGDYDGRSRRRKSMDSYRSMSSIDAFLSNDTRDWIDIRLIAGIGDVNSLHLLCVILLPLMFQDNTLNVVEEKLLRLSRRNEQAFRIFGSSHVSLLERCVISYHEGSRIEGRFGGWENEMPILCTNV
jgi:hypothetical protein